MDFDLNADERAVMESVRALVASRPGPEPAAHEAPVEFDRDMWSELAHRLGMVSMALPEACGGDGGGLTIAGLVVRELGAQLYGGPYLSCLLGALGLVESENEQARDVLGRTIEGSSRPTYAPGPGALVRVQAASTESVLNGVARGVLDATTASHVLVEAADDSGSPAHYLVDLGDPGVQRVREPAFDVTRETGTLTFTDARAVAVDGDDADVARERHARAVDRAKALVASEQVGGSRTALRVAVDHARVRHQFGRPIGSFQGVKHPLADALVQIELAEVMVDHILCRIDAVSPVGDLAAAALATASETYSSTALLALHTHGGLGITWESGLHRHVRRAKATSALLGTPAHQRRIALAELGW